MLAKPFTKDGMVRILKKLLPWLLKDPPPPGSTGDDMTQNGNPGGAPPAYAGLSLAGTSAMGAPGGVKFEGGTPIQSPATTGSWHSPSQLPHPSPHLDGYMGGRTPMVMTPTGMQPSGFPPVGTPGGDDRPEKRQRLYGPAGGY